MARNHHSIGNAGEFYVLAQLAQRGYIAGKTDDGQTLIDVIATDPDTLNTVNIQVKTTRDGGQKWVMGTKTGPLQGSLVRLRIHQRNPSATRLLCLQQR